MAVDYQELAELLGYSPGSRAAAEATKDFSVEQPPVEAPIPAGHEDPLIEIYPNEAVENVDPYATRTDFAPQTYDFGNERAQTYEYDNQGNLIETLPNGAKVKVAQTRAESGYSPDKMAQIEAGPMGSQQMAKKKQSAEDKIRAQYEPYMGQMQKLTTEGVQLADAAGNAEAAQIEARAAGKGKVASLMNQHASEIQGLSESALIAKQQAKDEYRAKLLSIQEVNPSALWDEAGPGGQVAIAAAAVIHEMLNVKGIKTSAMDTINQAIRNKIDAQIANINSQKFVASGFKDLWDMTVQESDSLLEAKTKMHGYMLKALEAQVDADMGRYDANVARVKHQIAKNTFRQAQLKNMMEVEQHIDRTVDQAYQREVQIRGQNIQAAIARENNKTELEVARMRANAGKETPNPYEGILIDPSESGGGLVARRFLPDVKEEKRFEIREKAGAMAGTVWGIRKLRELHKEAGPKADLLGDTRFAKETTRAANVMSKYAQLSLAYAKSGKQLSANEIAHYEKMFANPTWFTNGDNIRQLGKLQEALAKEIQLTVAPHTVKVSEGDPLYNVKLGTADEYFAGEISEGEVYGAPDKGAPTTSSALESLGRPDSSAANLNPLAGEEREWEKFKENNPDAASKLIDKKRNRVEMMRKYGTAVGPAAETAEETKPPQAHADVYLLALKAIDNDPEAEQILTTLANPTEKTPEKYKKLEALADYYLEWAQARKPLTATYKAR